MSDSKAAIFILLGVLVLMTGIFTAFSAGEGGSKVISAGFGSDSDKDGFILVNGDEVTQEEFTSRVARVEQNLTTLKSQAESMPEDNEFASTLLEIMDANPPETVALASLILDTVIYQEALDRGHEPDDSVIRAQVEQERQLFTMIEANPAEFDVAEENVAAYRENIEQVGEERYWSEYYPEIVRKQTAVQDLQDEMNQSGGDWDSLQQEVFREADVEVSEPDAIAPATIDNATAYMESVWELSEDVPANS